MKPTMRTNPEILFQVPVEDHFFTTGTLVPQIIRNFLLSTDQLLELGADYIV